MSATQNYRRFSLGLSIPMRIAIGVVPGVGAFRGLGSLASVLEIEYNTFLVLRYVVARPHCAISGIQR
jgi:hypothetical protein